MKTLFPAICLLAVSVFGSCKKGRKLPDHLAVKFVPLSTTVITPEDNFPAFDENDLHEEVVSPKYVQSYAPAQVTADFNTNFRELLSKNNIDLVDTSATATYELRMSSLVLAESIDRHTYFDSCSMSQRFYYQSYLQVSVSATLYYNDVEIDSWTKVAKSQETVRTRTDRCNCPKIRRALRGPSALLDQAAKELRVQVSKKLYYEIYSN